ncbi:MAG: hypothetical protein JWM31_2561 [Solirubrobacterales bacterium]|nr:hypothetical protein [Solirubrobacterales bacterium]
MPAPTPSRESGFTLIEVLVAMTLIVVGLFPVLVLVDKGNTKSVTTLRAEDASNLARELVERAHGVPYANLTAAGAPATLMNAVDPSPSTRGVSATVGVSTPNNWSILSRFDGSTERTQVQIDVCSIFAPSKAVRLTSPGVRPCTSSSSPPTGSGSGGAVVTTSSSGCIVTATNIKAVGLLLVQDSASVCLPAQVSALVCGLLGPTKPLNDTLATLLGANGALSILGTSVSASICGTTPVAPTGSSTTVPDVARRVTATVTPASGPAVSVSTVVPSS